MCQPYLEYSVSGKTSAARAIGGITRTDINNLRFMFTDLGIVSRIANVPLEAAEKTIRLKSEGNT